MTDAASAGPVKARARIPRRAPPLRRGPESQAAIRALRVQPMLRVGAADDPAEREAEATAERVVAMSAPAAAATAPAPSAAPPPPPSARRASAEDQPSLDSFETEPPTPAGQEDVEVPPAEDVNAEGLSAEDMNELERGAPEDTGGEDAGGEDAGGEDAPPPEDGAGEAMLSRAAAVGPEGGDAPADVAARVAQPGAGRPLPAETRAFMEPRFGLDFSDVRLHDAPEDRTAARRIGARAFTLGRRIWLGEGETPADRRLMAHELTHVAQQTKRKPTRRPLEAARAVIRRGLIADEAEGYARQIPGYRLLCVILGKSPITDERVTRSAENLIGGFMGLLPGGEILFQRLQETRVLQRAYEWVTTRLGELDITWSRISRIIDRVWDIFPSLSPFEDVKRLFRPLIDDIKTFVGDIRDKILEFIVHGALKLAGPWGERVWAVVQQAREAISMILDDPLGFAKNLIAAVMRGFGLFRDNIWEHLKRGLMGWLFGAIATIGVKIPDKLDFKGLLTLGLDILGLTYDAFRATLVKRLGPGGERKVAFLEKSVEVVTLLAKEGFLGLWQKLLGMIENFKQTVIGGLRDLVITSVVRAGLSWLAGLTNPIGGIVKICLSIYDMIVVFLERLEQIRAFVGAIFSSIAAIARGQVQAAGDFIERTLGAAVPLVISFLAAILGLNTIPQKIRQVIEKLRKPIRKALDRMLTFLIKKAKKLLSKLVAKLNSKRKLPGKRFRIGKKRHRIFAKKKGGKVELVVASKETPLAAAEQCVAAETAKFEDPVAKAKGQAIDGAIDKTEKDAKPEIAKIDLNSQNRNQLAEVKSLEKDIAAAADAFEKAGKDADKHPEIDTSGEQCLIRAQEPRNPDIEGETDTHAEIKRKTTQALPGGSTMKWSSFYQSDHVIEKQFARTILRNLQKIDPRKSATTRGEAELIRHAEGRTRAGGTMTKAEAGAKSLGKIGSRAAGFDQIDEAGDRLPAIAIHRGVHVNKARPLVQPDALVERAAGADDPHAAVQAALRDQFGHEAGSLNKLYAADEDATKAIRAKVRDSLKTLAERNAALYGFDAAAAKRKATLAERTAGAPAGSQSTFTFTPRPGESGRPDFGRIEGVGVDYRDRQKGGFGHILQYDHVIEKDFPLTAKGFALDDPRLKPRILAKARALAGGAPPRPDAVDGARIVPTGPMTTYDEDSGYSVPIYAPIHDLTRSGVYSVKRPDAILEDMPDAVIDAAARAMTAKTDAAAAAEVDAARGAARRHMRARFRARVAEHAAIVNEAYRGEVPRVVAANPPEAAAAARQAMVAIAGKVAASLRQADARTVALVPD